MFVLLIAIVHLKMKILSFTHPYVVDVLNDDRFVFVLFLFWRGGVGGGGLSM